MVSSDALPYNFAADIDSIRRIFPWYSPDPGKRYRRHRPVILNDARAYRSMCIDIKSVQSGSLWLFVCQRNRAPDDFGSARQTRSDRLAANLAMWALLTERFRHPTGAIFTPGSPTIADGNRRWRNTWNANIMFWMFWFNAEEGMNPSVFFLESACWSWNWCMELISIQLNAHKNNLCPSTCNYHARDVMCDIFL